jgi:lipopolysaccharide/colanic/teichoic acid biosynthesis glycosyltransferase
VEIAPSQQKLLRGGFETPAPKRILDISFALVVLTIGFPVLCLIALCIAL